MKSLVMDWQHMSKLTGACIGSLGAIMLSFITKSDFAYWVGILGILATIFAGITTGIKNIKEGKLLASLFKRKKQKPK